MSMNQAGDTPIAGAHARRWDFLAGLMNQLGFKNFVEVGCKGGRTTGFILANVPDSTVLAIDPWAAMEKTIEPGRETDEDWDAGGGEETAAGPTDGHVGTLDLLYRDPATAELVVADFKSDTVDEGPAVDALVARYRPQLALYGRAVQAALALAAPPRLELWLLAIDRVVTLSAAEAGGESG